MSNYPFYFTWCQQPEQSPFCVERAEHDQFILTDGRRVYDFLSTSFQTNFGHSHAGIQASIREQLDRMPIASPKADFALKTTASQSLNALVSSANGKVFYTVSGSESVENALKMARQITGRTKVLARSRSYHGATLGALSVTGDWRNAPHLTWDEQTVRIPEPDDDPYLDATRQALADAQADTVAAVIVETITGANGVISPAQSWFDGLQHVCRDHDLLLILDEVLCGFGRTGPPFAFQRYQGVEPDFVCMSKGITGGYIPFGAVWTSPRVAAFYENAMMACGLTNYAHPLGLAAMQAVIETLGDADFARNKHELEIVFAAAVDDLLRLPAVQTTRCVGLLAAIELHDTAPTWETFFRAGLHLFSNGNTVVLAPPLVSTPDRLRAACELLQKILTTS